MLLGRPTFLALATASAASEIVISSPRARAATMLNIRAIAFEA
jgi:hypothetical protein